MARPLARPRRRWVGTAARHWWLVLAVVMGGLLGACTGSGDPRSAPSAPTAGVAPASPATEDAVDLVLGFLGGRAALSELSQFDLTVVGERWLLFEGPDPSVAPPVSTYTSHWSFDVPGDRLRLDTTRSRTYGITRFEDPLDFTIVADGPVGWAEGANAPFPAGRVPDHVMGALDKQVLLLNPQLLVRESLDRPDLLTGPGVVLGGAAHRLLRYDDGERPPIDLLIDPDTGRIDEVRTVEHNPLARDVEVRVVFDDWATVLPVAFAHDVKVFVDDVLVRAETREVIDFPSVRTQPDPFVAGGPLGATVLDPSAYDWGWRTHEAVDALLHLGVYAGNEITNVTEPGEPVRLSAQVLLVPSAVNTLVVEHDGGLVVFEAPGTPDYAARVQGLVAETFPGRPVTHVVPSHHHVDHAAGVRTFVAAGAGLVVGPGTAGFWRDVMARPSEVWPDDTGGSSVEMLEVREGGVADLPVDGVRISIVHVPGNDHAGDLVVPVVDAGGERFVFVADLHNAGLAVTVALDGEVPLFDALRRQGIIETSCAPTIPTTIVPAHGRPVPLATSIAQIEGDGIDLGCA